MNDRFTLAMYRAGKSLKFYELMDNWTLMYHLDNYNIPDHYYQRWNTYALTQLSTERITSLRDVFLKCLPKFCKYFLMVGDNDIVRVKDGKWDEWQTVARCISPLVMKAILLWSQRKNDKETLEKNFKYTALPLPQSTIIQSICEEKGLSDTHIHLNGSEEFDRIWINIRDDRRSFISEERMNLGNAIFSEQHLFKNYEELDELIEKAKNIADSIDTPANQLSTLSNEALKIISAFEYLKDGGGTIDVHKLHYYLLIEGAIRSFYIMQSHQLGLAQFNRILATPFVGLAYYSDGTLIHQLSGNEGNVHKSIELRLSPSAIKSKANDLIEGTKKVNKTGKDVKVSFLCSMSKSAQSKGKTEDYRNQFLSENLSRNYKPLVEGRDKLCGIDFTGSDWKASPDAFATIVRQLRQDKIAKHYTYHAGEDFFHVLGGLRKIFEVVLYLNYKEGDRIGHASAAGVSPTKWAELVDGYIPMQQGEYLDDLVFAYYFITYYCDGRQDLVDKLDKIKAKITELGRDVYGTELNIENLIEAWKQRANADKVFETDNPNNSQKLIKDYLKYRRKDYDKIIIVGCFDIFTPTEIKVLQVKMLKFLADKKIAIEACPTSNVTIGYDRHLRSYHLITWLKWKYIKHLDVPTIIIGTDETCSMNTNIVNEYAAVYDMLKESHVFTDEQCDKIIQELVDDSNRLIFK